LALAPAHQDVFIIGFGIGSVGNVIYTACSVLVDTFLSNEVITLILFIK